MAAALAAATVLAGCGMPGAPLPPSLNLPERVGDLTAVRTGGQVTLNWTMPTKNTDKTLLKGTVAVRVCRNEQGVGGCLAVARLQQAAGANGAFTDTLPAALASGKPRVLTYFVELDNRKGRSAGLSNSAETLAGEAPPAVSGLSAEMRKDGVLLGWNAGGVRYCGAAGSQIIDAAGEEDGQEKNEQGALAPPAEPLERTLLVKAGLVEAGAAGPRSR